MFLTILYFLVIATALQWIYKHLRLRYQFKDLPAPPSLPFFGHLLPYLKIHPSDYYDSWSKQFNEYFQQNGKAMCVLWVGFIPVLILRCPQQTEIILSSSKHVKKSIIYHFLKDWMGEGIFVTKFKLWFSQRKMLTPAFHLQNLSEFADIMAEGAELMNKDIANRLKNHPNTPINILDYASKYTLKTLCETAMGIKMDIQCETHHAYSEAIEKFVPLVMMRSLRPWLYLDFIFYRTKKGQEYKRAIEVLHDFTSKVIRQRQIERANNRNDNNKEIGRKRKAFLDLLLDISEHETKPLTLEEIREQIDVFMFAGHDTTSTAIVWTMFLLGNNLDIQDKVHKEMDEVFSNDSRETITQKQLGQLKYLDLVIKESLRIYPSAPIVIRKLTEDTWLDGILVPEGTDVGIFIEKMHNNPEIWENPSKFDPDRFLPENSKNRHPYAYIPFSAGPRNCIGKKFGLSHLKITLAALLRKWKVESLIKPDEIKLRWYLTINSKEPINVLLTPRS